MRRFSKGLITVILLTIFMALVALPDSIKSKLPSDPVSTWIKSKKVTLGLDLQGGTQLDYRIDLRSVRAKNEDNDPNNDVKETDIINGVQTTIERRVNNLGVSEPQIFISRVGDEPHIIVELAGIKDIEQAKALVGKTIQLEFKEKRGKDEPDDSTKQMRSEAEKALTALKQGETLEAVGSRIRTSDGKIDLRVNKSEFESDLPIHYKNVLNKLADGQTNKALIEGSDGFVISGGGAISEKKGIYLVQLVGKETKDHTTQTQKKFDEVAREVTGKDAEHLQNRLNDTFADNVINAINAKNVGDFTDVLEVKDEATGLEEYHLYKVVNKNVGSNEVKASHILISYKGAQGAAGNITFSKAQAKKEAERILNEVKKNPDQFADYAKKYSNDPSAQSNNGDLGFFGRGRMTKAFEEAAFNTSKGDFVGPVETEFGYHVIYVTDSRSTEPTVDVDLIKVGKTETGKKKMDQAVADLTPHDVSKKELSYTFNEIFFDTTPDPWKPTGLDGSHFKFATVVYDQLGVPQVNIQFDSTGGDLFEQLTGRLSGQQMAIFVGGELVSAPTVNQKITGGNAVITGNFSVTEALKLATDLNTGAIDAPIILSGQYTISATLGESALSVSLYAGMIGVLALCIAMILYYRFFGLIADLALLTYTIIMVFLLKTTPIVMTLAGIAGIVLSIGMAVDANILIFERTREELNAGRSFSGAIAAGFDRAWTSIRDSNVSSLITCAILWFFGNSIIRGFALMLAIGILISMFTAITFTRQIIRTLEGSRVTKSKFLLGVKQVN